MNEESVFAEACTKKTPAERSAFLDGACGRNNELRNRVEQLLAAHANPDEFLEEPPPGVERDVEQTVGHSPSLLRKGVGKGTRIGRYKLLEEIGEGGMGTVWVAEQTEPVRRKVALKLVKAGMDSAQVVARFNAERQALAVMDHPNIAKVYDGGLTEQGRPYFVMEYVKGAPLTEYCDQAKLPLRERLQLFALVCQAVQHAHQKGIIHRDLKPSNILACLYDGHPVPKVIDFGLAKAMHQPLTEQTLHTAHGMMLGTPMYMSPEQAEFNNLDVDTRTDIYSLGVILYELLTGTTPLEKQQFKEVAMNEILRLIKEVEPPKPSTRLSGSASLPNIAAQRSLDAAQLRRSVRGDLDWIVMKALDKERSRRYETANGLARDIERFLNEEAVEACPPTTSYRLRKFARKHSDLIATASGIAFILLLSLLVVIGQRNRAKRAEYVAIREKDNALMSADNERIARQRAQSAEMLAKFAAERAQTEEKNAKRQIYFTEMVLAWDAYREGNIFGAKNWCDQHRNSTARGVEWQLLENELASIPEPWIDVENMYPTGIEVSDNGQIFAIQGKEQVHIYDSNGNITSSINTPLTLGYRKTNFSLSRDGKQLVYQSEPNVLRIRDLATSDENTIPCHGMKPVSSAFSPELSSGLLAIGDAKGDVHLVNWKTGELVQLLKQDIALSNFDRAHRLRDRTTQVLDYPGILNIRFSADGTKLAVVGSGGWLTVWSCTTGEALRAWEHERALLDADFSPDGNLVATCRHQSPHEIYLWNIATGELHGRLTGHTGMIHAVKFLADGRLASSGRDNTIRIWDIAQLREMNTLRGHSHYVWALAVDSSGQHVYSASLDGKIQRWNLASTQYAVEMRPRVRTQVSDLETTADGQKLFSTQIREKEVQIWDIASGTLTSTLSFNTAVYPLAVSAKNTLAVGGTGAVYLHDISSGLTVELKAGSSWIRGLDFSPDGRYLVAANAEHELNYGATCYLHVWDLQNLAWNATATNRLIPIHSQVLADPAIHCLKWSQDGQFLAGAGKEGVYLWNAQNWISPPVIVRAHTQPVEMVAWSPDGKTLASCGQDLSIRLLDVTTKVSREFVQAHSGFIWQIAFSHDANAIISTSGDGSIGIWDVATGQLRARMPGHIDGAFALLLTRDRKRMVTGGLWDGKIRVWRME